jgi:uncharacterized SAM-binding protein YcdF (DUF218 family)
MGRRTLKNLLISLGALLAVVTIVPPAWYGRWLATSWAEAQAPVLIVLGGDSIREGMMGNSSYWRTVYAVDVWHEGGINRIILSGDEQTTASMRAWIVGQGVPPEAVAMENHSHSTRENAVQTTAFLRNTSGPYILMTSDIHMWRAVRAFRKAGLTVLPRPAPDAFKRANDWRDRWRVFLDIALEYSKIVYYRSKSWI